MRLKRLDLKAFGPFTDRTLEFDSEEPGLHIIFGPNEAGKSSSLRALKALLYGFPQQTPDNFLHNYDQLQVGGCLQGADGKELFFWRRKKKKADLLDSEGNPIDHGELAGFLHGVEPALFESLYGIDHKTLEEGGKDILAQKGEVGQALFAAGAGISSLHKILDSLDTGADELFRSRGTKQQINQAIKEYKELKKIVKEKSLPSSKWKEHKKRLQDAEDEQARLEKESRQKSVEAQRLERLNKAIPELAEMENLKKQLQDLGDVVVLPSDFPEQRQQVELDIRQSKLQLDKDSSRLEKLKAKQKENAVNQPLLDHAETIEDLHQRLDRYRNGKNDRIRLDGMRISNRKDAAALIKEVRPDLRLEDAESLRPVLSKKRTIQTLGSQYEALTQQISQAQKLRAEAEKDLKEIGDTLSDLPAVRERDGLTKAWKPARKAGDLDGQIEGIVREIGEGEKACQAELKRLGLWSGELGQLLELPLPLQETMRHFEAEYGELEDEKRQLKKDRRKAEAELKATKVDSKEVEYGGEVPTEENLKESRNKREDGWQLLRRKWLDGEDISKEAEKYEPGRAVHDAYEKHVAQADYIADRLRREAERVTKAAALRARVESLEEAIQEFIQQEQEVAKREENLAANWQDEWKPIKMKPLSPKEMLAWLAAIDTLRFKVTETLNKENEAKEKDKLRQEYREVLLEELTALEETGEFSGKELAPVLIFAESVLDTISENKAELEKLSDKKVQVQKALDKAKKEQKVVETAKGEWQTKWDKALAGLGLTEQVQPSEALDLLETIADCFDKLEKAEEFQSRINGIDRDVKEFANDVQALQEQVDPDLKDLPLDQAVLQLHTMLGKARQDNELLKKHGEEVEAITIEIQDAEKTLQSLAGQMADLLAIAKCDEAVELVEAIRKSAEHQRLQEKISNAEASLAKVSEGVSLEEIKRRAGEVDVDELPGLITTLSRQIEEELYPQIKHFSQVIGEENKELQRMDGSAAAAEAAEKLEQVAARIQRLTDQYVRIKLAAKVLQDEIERYRAEHQDPILKIASRYFSELTLNSFAGLRADVDDKGEPILVGIRPDDSRLQVDGMSDGTCDQLYLALRLATLEWRLQSSEPMPFIVDDILVNFDDDRSRTTLQALADLAEKNQVILFTHHRQIINDAKKIKGKGSVHVHELT